MKQILRTTPLATLVLAGLTLSAQAALPADNVGDVTLYGNITANSPMWQWTVNDYPGPRLDAKPSSATVVDGKTTYPLSGQWFMAASGYLPSFVPRKIGTVETSLGMKDITTLSSPDGAVMPDVSGTVATLTMPANGGDASGKAIKGALTLEADAGRGYAYVLNSTGTPRGGSFVFIAKSSAAEGQSCWVGNPLQNQNNWTKKQTTTSLPRFSYSGPSSASGAASAYSDALAAADAAGSVRYVDAIKNGSVDNDVIKSTYKCADASPPVYASHSVGESVIYNYASSAHVLALRPTKLTFPVAASGAWSATLTVTAAQM